MTQLLEYLKVLVLGIVEGITEWLPISSTGHMLLVDEFFTLNQDEAFKEMFFIVIQLGAILAVLILFWDKMFPFRLGKEGKKEGVIRGDVFSLWFKVVVACIPGAAVTLLFDDYIEAHFHTPTVIACALILYGVAFLLVEGKNKDKAVRVHSLSEITYKDAFYIGLFQVLSIIPGTSRSGSTIVGARILGVSRVAAAEFTFFLAVPVMLGYSALKLLKFGLALTATQWGLLLFGCAVAFLTSLFVIRFLMDYVKKHDFSLFGWYRIVLGLLVLGYFAFA
ncbi:MAG: undecaprenyl-diphosphate phosphatase [Clostridia bacterium]|nr:undecaprenyl-diphosphate phosphatase [Clostridia bacterium]